MRDVARPRCDALAFDECANGRRLSVRRAMRCTKVFRNSSFDSLLKRRNAGRATDVAAIHETLAPCVSTETGAQDAGRDGSLPGAFLRHVPVATERSRDVEEVSLGRVTDGCSCPARDLESGTVLRAWRFGRAGHGAEGAGTPRQATHCFLRLSGPGCSKVVSGGGGSAVFRLRCALV
jgi:hypothetical protein